MKNSYLNFKITLIIILFGMINLISIKTYGVLTVNIVTISNVTCYNGNDGQAAAHATGGVIPYTYFWSINSETTDTATGLFAGTFTVTVTDAVLATATATVTINQPNPFIPTISPIDTSICAGSSITLTASLGISYSWFTGETTQSISASTSGSYGVTVTNGSGCTGQAVTSVTVNPLPTPTIWAGGPTSFCTGGSVTLTCQPAQSSYLWSDGETTQSIVVTTSGTWTVSVIDPNGCNGTSAATTTTVSAGPTPTINPSGTVTICTSQNVTLTSSAGSSYLWSTNATTQAITVNSAGSYTVTITNFMGCSGTSLPTVVNVINTAPPAPGSITGSINDVQGYSYTYSVAPVAGATSYVWTMPSGWVGTSSTNSINLFPGASNGNICVVAVNSCGNSTPSCLHVNIVNCNTTFILYPDTTILHHYYVTDTIYGQSPYHYNWSWGDLSQNDTIAYPSHTYADSGVYTICLTITDNTGCQSTFCDSNYHIMRTMNYMVYVNVIPHNTVGINQPELANTISLYPNPTTGNVTLTYSQLSTINSHFIITDITGREVYSQQLNYSTQSTINLTKLSNGIYFWKLISGNSISDKGKIAVMK